MRSPTELDGNIPTISGSQGRRPTLRLETQNNSSLVASLRDAFSPLAAAPAPELLEISSPTGSFVSVPEPTSLAATSSTSSTPFCQVRARPPEMIMGSYAPAEDMSLGSQALLAKIDKLRELNVGSMVPLPQLVVVGDQSSGKSSVLESLTGFSFPRATTLCTRYATQITCRRDTVKSVTISIIPGPNAGHTHKEKLRRFERRANDLSDDDLAAVFEAANEAMGIRGDGDEDTGLNTFSEDVLKIEIKGPAESHLTVIDVPGIFRTATAGLTTENDITLVKNMVQNYMKDTRTIILAVIPCNVDIATQEILKLAKDVDPKGIRTMGVLTKPDLAVERATIQDAIDLVLGKRNPLRLGYCVVKNRGADDNSSTLRDRNVHERTFFSADPWSQVARSERSGIDSLKRRLRELLTDISRREFPAVKKEILKRLGDSRKKLDAIGPSRSDTAAQRIYLGKLSDQFQQKTKYALDAYYSRDQLFRDREEMRLITRVIELNEVFADVFSRKGHKRNFEDDKDGQELVGCAEPTFEAIDPDDFPEIQDILADPYECEDPLDECIREHIESEFKRGRGRELATVPSALLATTFKEQTQKWEPLVLSHVSDAILVVHYFISELLKLVCPEKTVRDELWDAVLLDEVRAAYQRAMDHARFLLEVEREGCPMTLNHYFTANLEKSRLDRLTAALEELFGCNDPNEDLRVNRNMLKGVRSEKSNAQHIRDEIHDTLKSYYRVSRKRFVDIVCQQVVDYYLLSGPRSPLSIFSNARINRMTEEQLDMIAGEDAGTKRERTLLTREIDSLEKAMAVLRG